MKFASRCFLSLLLLCNVAFAQSSNPGASAQVEVTRTKASDIPAQYRADAVKPRKPFAVRYTCPDAGRVYVVFDNAQQTATLEMGNTTRYLKQGKSGSGARYVNSDESYVFWVKGNEATINGRETCVAD
jgi:membrane-bound inhibitor of C-type lysozyme